MSEELIPDLGSLPLFQTPISSPVATRFKPLIHTPTPDPAAVAATSDGWSPNLTVPAAELKASPGPDELDWQLVDQMRREISERLTTALRGEAVSDQQTHQLGRDLIKDVLQTYAQDSLRRGSAKPLTLVMQDRMASALDDALFGLGRLQPLVDREDVENIEGYGCDMVTLEDANGDLHPGPPVAESDSELIDFLSFLASRQARPFSEAVPRLHLRLPGGARLAAVAYTTPRPIFVIRRHRLQHVTLQDLIDRQTIDPNLATFLAAAVRANLSIVVAGSQGAGKTTAVRALCSEIPDREKIGTFETEYELHLHEEPNRHGRVFAFEARPGSGERGANGRLAGEVTLTEEMYDSFRLNLDRQIVGEVRGDEVLPMIKAMQSGSGSISTTHAKSARQALSKLVTCAMEAGASITQAYATKAIAETLDIIVFIRRDDTAGSRRRIVTEVVSVGWTDDEGVNYTDIYTPGPDGTAQPHVLPDNLRYLTGHGFDLEAFQRTAR